MPAYLICGLFALVGAVFGVFVPYLSNAMLGRKFKQMQKHWDDNFENLKGWLAEHNGMPDRRASGDEGALGVWVQKQQAASMRAQITREHSLALKELSISDLYKYDERLETNEDRATKFSFMSTVIQRVFIIALCAVMFGFAGYFYGPLYAAAMCVFLAFVPIISIIDIRVRLVPYEFYYALFAYSIIFQAVFFGLEGLGGAAAAVLIILGVFVLSAGIIKLMDWVMKRPKTRGLIGGGDIWLVIPIAIACGFDGLVYMLLGFVVAVALYFVAGYFRYKLTSKSTFPMAPFLCVGLVSGLLLPVLF